jgi:hypothetical protein
VFTSLQKDVKGRSLQQTFQGISLLGYSVIFPQAETQSYEFHLVSAIFFQRRFESGHKGTCYFQLNLVTLLSKVPLTRAGVEDLRRLVCPEKVSAV